MNSFLLTGQDANSRRQYITNLTSPKIELIHVFAEKSSIAIKQIKDLSIPLKIVARIPRLIWIEEANLLTSPAQNALLKILEEPPKMTSFYLSCQNSAMLLPTITSRTKTISLGNLELENDPKILADLKAVLSQTPGDRLSSIVKRDRSESLIWLTQIEQALKSKLKDKDLSLVSTQTLAKIASSVLQAHKELLANCSVGLVTQNFYLKLPKIK